MAFWDIALPLTVMGFSLPFFFIPTTTIALKQKNPSRINDLGFLMEPDGTSRDVPEPRYMWSIITWPKAEHDTCVAPSIRRAKS